MTIQYYRDGPALNYVGSIIAFPDANNNNNNNNLNLNKNNWSNRKSWNNECSNNGTKISKQFLENLSHVIK